MVSVSNDSFVAQTTDFLPTDLAITPETIDYFIPERLNVRDGTYRFVCPLATLKNQCAECFGVSEPQRTRLLRKTLLRLHRQHAGKVVYLTLPEWVLLYVRNRISFDDLVTLEFGRYMEIRNIWAYFQTLSAFPELERGRVRFTFGFAEQELIHNVTDRLVCLNRQHPHEPFGFYQCPFPPRPNASEPKNRCGYIELTVSTSPENHLEALRMYGEAVVQTYS